MIRDLRETLSESRATLISDIAGLAALVTLFLGALHLPGLF